jgi:hypothetical protein
MQVELVNDGPVTIILDSKELHWWKLKMPHLAICKTIAI